MTEQTAPPTIFAALSAVMGDVQAIGKNDRNTQQNFRFRGIDAVMSAVGPALRKHGVIVVPLAEDIQTENYTTTKGTAMRNVTLRIRWRFHGPAGDHIEAVSYGEASDSGDKAVSKAHSVAYRTVLLQALCIPTDEPDPDASSYERAEETGPSEVAKTLFAAVTDAPALNALQDVWKSIQDAHGEHQITDREFSQLSHHTKNRKAQLEAGAA